jgi:hypothetical protein
MFSRHISKNFQKLTQKGYKMTNVHVYQGANRTTRSGLKVCIFGANAVNASKIIDSFLFAGYPTVMAHRRPIDVCGATGDDVTFTRGNPYNTMMPFMLNFDVINEVYRYKIDSNEYKSLRNRYQILPTGK